MNLAQSERHALCQLLLQVGPDAPTLCEGWTTLDLAEHLWVRENDVLAMPGIVAQPFERLTRARMRRAGAKGYEELVARVDSGAHRLSPFALSAVDAVGNSMEYLVHHEDVRRANGQTQPRELGQQAEELCWMRVKSMASVMLRRSPVGVVACWGDRRRVLRAGEGLVQLRGKPSEMVLFMFGRKEAAQLDLVGDEADVRALREAPMGV